MATDMADLADRGKWLGRLLDADVGNGFEMAF